MKQYFILLFFLIFNSIGMAQTLTFEEAKSIAHQLYEIELLSEKGEKVLVEGLEEFCVETKSDSIKKNFILKFLYYAFDTDSYYRSGTPTQKQHEILSLQQGFENTEVLKVEEIIKN